MKQTILICDCCKLPVPAVKSVDLCQKHIDSLKYNRRAKSTPANRPKSKAWNKADYDVINAKIVELAEARPFFTGKDVQRVAKVKTAVAYSAIRQLIAAGKIVATGSNRSRKLSKAS